MPGGALATFFTARFHARDAHLVLSAGAREPIPFRVLLDDEAPGPSHGVDVDEDGEACSGTVACTGSCDSRTPSATRRWRSRSSSQPPRCTYSHSGNPRWNSPVTFARPIRAVPLAGVRAPASPLRRLRWPAGRLASRNTIGKGTVARTLPLSSSRRPGACCVRRPALRADLREGARSRAADGRFRGPLLRREVGKPRVQLV